LNKKLAASLTIAIFLLSTIAVFAPVQAHFTLGKNNEGVYPYTVQNFDPHAPGVLGYVWPGGGENTYLGSPTRVTNNVGPGYTAPYPVNALTAAGVYNPSWTQNLAQLDGHEYSPSGAIVVSSTGDLIFAINASQTWGAEVAQVLPAPSLLSTLLSHPSSRFQTSLNRSLQRSPTITPTLSLTQSTHTIDTFQVGL